MMDVTVGGSAAWIPVLCNEKDEQEAELEDYLDGNVDPARSDDDEGEMIVSNKVDPNSKDTDTLEQSMRRAGLRPLR